ncbi:GNAT family N-acetyltransferase [Lapidilactobacillus achengensis]|uniref:GNAT family N-acetyltransferase n=1 Tax=Lapidilactobacillus achengensis TaxID=2486000 RepID=A0ABW1UQN4_9LACO|nr:N-acetyltransferase [Lapidilactobacillus achengensis]
MTTTTATNSQTNASVIIRNEQSSDYQRVEDLTRAAFYNLYMPGCVEHYLVHVMRGTKDFIEPLDLVIELAGQVIGSIMYTRAWLTDDAGNVKPILTFGPLAVDPAFQRQGYGKMLIEASFNIARALGEDTVVIFGMPANYVARGFKCCRDLNVSLPDGSYPAAMMVKTLRPEVLGDRHWHYAESPVMAIAVADAEAFDNQLPAMAKHWQPSQEEFNIISRATITVLAE